MDYLIQFQLNIYAILILLILYVMVIKKSEIECLSKKIMKYTILATIFANILEPLTWIFDERIFFGSYLIEYSTNFLLVLMAPILGAMMLSYVDYKIYKDLSRLKKRLLYSHFAIITTIILVVNIFFPLYFSVNPDTILYQAEAFQWFHYVLNGSMYLYMLVFVLVNRKRTFSYVVKIFLLIFSLPIIGMIVQIININLNLSWTSIALSILVIYVFLESYSGERDYLTQLYNRASYEKYVNHLIEIKKEFSVFLLDLDKFKRINDENGHQAGDKVLVEFSRILKKAFHPNQIVCRLAGDEFVIVIENKIDIQETLDNLYKTLKETDEELLGKLKFSYGVQTYEDNMNVDQLYNLVDQKMYKDKEKSK